MIYWRGFLIGFGLIAVASMIESLARSANLAGAAPSFSESLNGLLLFGPVILYVGFSVLLLSATRRIIISLVLALIFTVILSWLILWG